MRPLLPSRRPASRLSIVEGDLLDASLQREDVIFTHASCFEPSLLTALEAKLVRELRPGARVVIVGRQLHADALDRTYHGSCLMDWGEAEASIYVRRG